MILWVSKHEFVSFWSPTIPAPVLQVYFLPKELFSPPPCLKPPCPALDWVICCHHLAEVEKEFCHWHCQTVQFWQSCFSAHTLCSSLGNTGGARKGWAWLWSLSGADLFFAHLDMTSCPVSGVTKVLQTSLSCCLQVSPDGFKQAQIFLWSALLLPLSCHISQVWHDLNYHDDFFSFLSSPGGMKDTCSPSSVSKKGLIIGTNLSTVYKKLSLPLAHGFLYFELFVHYLKEESEGHLLPAFKKGKKRCWLLFLLSLK